MRLDPDAAAARADLSRFLAACYYEPAPEFAEERLFASMELAAERIDARLASEVRSLGVAFSERTLDELLVDYTRLFLGPTGAPARPYGSMWCPGGDEGILRESTMALLALYREGGFEMSEDFREAPDHVAAELEFLYLLLFREAEARGRGDEAAAREAEELRRRLVRGHLAVWIPAFAKALRAHAGTEFYRRLADVTERFVGLPTP